MASLIKLTAPQRRLLIEAGINRRDFLKFLGKGAAVAANPTGALKALGSLGSLGSKAATVVSKFKGNPRNEIYILFLSSLAGGSREHLTALANSYPYLDSSGNTKQYTPSDFLKDVSRYDFCIGGHAWDVADEWTNGGWSRLATTWANKVGVRQFFKDLDQGQMWEGALSDVTGNVIDKIPEVQKVFSKFGVRNGNDWDKLKFNKKNEIFREIDVPQEEGYNDMRAREKNDLRGWARNTQFRFPGDFGEQPITRDPRYPKELESPFESKLTCSQRQLIEAMNHD